MGDEAEPVGSLAQYWLVSGNDLLFLRCILLDSGSWTDSIGVWGKLYLGMRLYQLPLQNDSKNAFKNPDRLFSPSPLYSGAAQVLLMQPQITVSEPPKLGLVGEHRGKHVGSSESSPFLLDCL